MFPLSTETMSIVSQFSSPCLVYIAAIRTLSNYHHIFEVYSIPTIFSDDKLTVFL